MHGIARHRIALALLVLAAGITCLGPSAHAQGPKPAPGDVQTIDWKQLVPPGYDPGELVMKYNREVAHLKDDDPRAQQLAEGLRRAWESAPVVESLNNRMVKLAGFLVSLEGDGKSVSEFLLVPYFGACIHVPPPPSNQIVLVRTGRTPYKVGALFQRVAVTGRLRTEAARNQLASASYVIEATTVEAHTP
jgi:uncharacterized protein